jgi:hypothetical protein
MTTGGRPGTRAADDLETLARRPPAPLAGGLTKTLQRELGVLA